MRNKPSIPTFIGAGVGAGLGATLAILFDPVSGRRRRAMVRDKAVHVAKAASCAVGGATRDLANRAHGLQARMRHLLRHEPVGDAILVERVRAKLGRVVSHAHFVDVEAFGGRVIVSGPVLAAEADGLLAAVRRVQGVAAVVDGLKRHETAAPGTGR